MAALAAIPSALLFPAPRLPAGHMVMGFDSAGRCPMLTDSGCSIYDQRPRTCRTYDCRIFAATGVTVDADKPTIVARASEWRFDVVRPGRRSAGGGPARLQPTGSAARTDLTGTALAVTAVRVHLSQDTERVGSTVEADRRDLRIGGPGPLAICRHAPARRDWRRARRAATSHEHRCDVAVRHERRTATDDRTTGTTASDQTTATRPSTLDDGSARRPWRPRP